MWLAWSLHHHVHGARRDVSPEIAVVQTAAALCSAALPEAYDSAMLSARPVEPLRCRGHATTRRLADGALRPRPTVVLDCRARVEVEIKLLCLELGLLATWRRLPA